MAANTTKVVTGKVRLSYAHLFKKHAAAEDQEPKYSVLLLIPKSDKKTLKALETARQAAIEQGKTSRWGGTVPRNLKNTLRDGDEEYDPETHPEMVGHMFMNVNSKNPPGIVDRNRQAIEDSTEVYSGCYARVSLNAYPYSVSGNKGVSFGLNHVQKLADGEFLGGRSNPEDDFDELDDEDDDDIL